MKICIVSPNLPAFYQNDPAWKFGGAEVQTAFIAGALAGAGHDITLVVANLTDRMYMPYPAINAFNEKSGVPGLRYVHPRITGLWRALRKADADVYFQRNAGMVTGVVGSFCRKHGRKFIYGAASNTDFGADAVGVEDARDRYLFRRGLRRADGFVVQNETQLAACRATMTSPVAMIPNGVASASPAAGKAEDRVLWVGGLRPVKRPEMLLELAQRLPDTGFTLVGAGPGANLDFAAGITARALQLPNMKVTGWLPQSEVIREVRGASLLVNTSSIEGFPNVYLEAWNHGVPVVAFVDVDNLIAEHNLGLICESLDEMEGAVRSLLGDDALRREMGGRARDLVMERYSREALAPLYDAFFRDITRADSKGI
jgi:glycosyltransferase involved in cell wall biosynthesis